MKTFLHKRKLFVSMIAAFAGILLGVAILADVPNGFLVVSLLVLFAILILFFSRDMSAKSILLVVAVILLFAGNVFVQNRLHVNQNLGGRTITITGYATDQITQEEELYSFVLRDCQNHSTGKKLSGKVLVNFAKTGGNKKITAGDKITLTCTLNDDVVLRDGVNTFNYKENIRYSTSFISGEVDVQEGKPLPSESIRQYVKDYLGEYLSYDSYTIATGLVLGDTTLIDDGNLESLRNVGVAHIFAVSGLHIGFVILLVERMLLGKRTRKTVSFAVTLTFVLLYAYVTGFSPSVVRAIVMYISFKAYMFIGKQDDLISSVSIAALVILLFRPFFLFDASFLMSVGAMLGICFVSHHFKVYTIRHTETIPKFFRRVITLFGTSLGATLGTMPFALFFFGKVTLIGIAVNMLVVPIISVVFPVIIIALLLPFLFIVMVPVDFVLGGIAHYSAVIDSTANSFLRLEMFALTILIFFLVMFAQSDLVITSKLKRRFATISLAICFVLATAVSLLPQQQEEGVFLSQYWGTSTVFHDGEDTVFLSNLTSQFEANQIVQYVQKYDMQEIDIWVADFSMLDITYFNQVKAVVNVKNIFTLSNASVGDNYVKIRQSGTKVLAGRDHAQDFSMQPVYYSTKLSFLVFEVGQSQFALSFASNDFEIQHHKQTLSKVEMVYTLSLEEQLQEANSDMTVVTAGYSVAENYSTKYIGDFTVSTKNGKMILIE